MVSLSRRDDPDARGRGETQIIDAAIALMDEGESFASMTVAAITARAGHTRTGFYFYFRDKRDLLMAATTRLVGGLFRDAHRWLNGSGGLEALATTLEAILVDYRRSQALIRALVEATSYDHVIAAYWHAELERFIDAAERQLPTTYVGTTRRGVASALVWMTERTYYLRILDDDLTGDEVAVRSLLAIWSRTLELEP
ncbi:TetR family transcriptional regulator [Patulibacter brassicae]|jgi:AcrR family transcriptional regulator|uniref:TetR family transcriptional regulator n=1 Tax=Patulibacter brassicae TaxID=1705717 RepID=A0ABU4VFU6_9ACTN|nr:TetR family transcriptional regulator [Patulibacter brassicae]MDX8150702.1 TetR family transcriptional regulator [Patulibacter brassicae]